jgi:single-stranded DNA-binding protein
MVIVSIFGTVASTPRSMKTQSGVQRVFFDVTSEDEGSFPFKYECVTFGAAAERILNEVTEGTKIFVSGRLTAGGVPRKVNLAVSGFEAVTEGVPANVD